MSVATSFDSDQALAALKAAPFAVLVVDEQATLLWANQAAQSLISGELIGQPITALPLLWQKVVVDNQITEISSQRYYGCERQTIVAAKPLTVYYLFDVTEQEQRRQEVKRLKREVELKTLRDENTGLLNKLGLIQMLEAQVTRSRRYHNPLAVIHFDFADNARLADHLQSILTAMAYKLNDQMRWADMIANPSGDSLLFILPETSKEAAAQLVEKIKNSLQALAVEGLTEPVAIQGYFGVVQWEEGDDPRKLLNRADEAMRQAKKQDSLVVTL